MHISDAGQRAVLMVLPLILSACQLVGAGEKLGPDVTIASGQSFGFCVGYCQRVLTMSADESVLVTQANPFANPDPEYPTLTQDWAMRPAQWDSLVALVDEDVFRNLDEVYGCPDCADGGAEWIEITFSPGQVARVTFEYSGTVDEIKELVEYARHLRQSAIHDASLESD